jgi:hypothetical protein
MIERPPGERHAGLSRRHIVACLSSHFLSLGKFLMRMVAIVLGCAALASCSSVEVASESIPPPDMSKAMPAVRSFATQVHLAEPLEFSGPLEAPSNYFQRWMLCLRSAATPKKTYALLFKKDDIETSHLSAVMDPCDGSQTYQPLPPGNAASTVTPTTPTAALPHHHHGKLTVN